jgi:hypothetical protein
MNIQQKNSREIFFDALSLKKLESVPVAPHWWGIYKYEVQGLDFKKDAWQEGDKLTNVYQKFYERFKPDWFHLHIGTPAYFKDSEIIRRGKKSFLLIDPSNRSLKKEDKYFSVNYSDDEEIIDFPDYILASRAAKPKVDLSNRGRIDEFIKKYIHLTSEEIYQLGYTDHVEGISRIYGSSVFIAVHIPSAVCEIFDPITGYTGFEYGLLSFHDQPEGMRYLLEKCYEEQLEWAKAFSKAGAHAFAISEAFISPDLVNPQVYRRFLKDIHKNYFSEVLKMGLYPLCYFTGDINPILEDLTEINIKGLMIEESKKNFKLEFNEIREKVGDKVCVFSNVDSIYLMNRGKADEVRKVVFKQLNDAYNIFIVCNGSPLTPGTPQENIDVMINAVRGYKPV